MIAASLLDDKTLHHADQIGYYSALIIAALVIFWLLIQPPNPPRST